MLTVNYAVKEAGPVTISLVDATGEVRATATNLTASPEAVASTQLDVSLLPRGAYLCILRTSSGSIVRAVAIE
jgi:hypothetical protein